MKSMTGHGRGVAAEKGARVAVECFSVNRKQGEVSVSVPRELAWMEPRVREETLKRIARGKVQVSIAIEHAPTDSSSLIDRRRAAEFLRAARVLQKELGLKGEVSLESVLAAPGVLRTVEESSHDLWPLACKALHAALDVLLTMRAKEGVHLQKVLRKSASQMAALVKRIRPLASRVPAHYRESLLRRLRAAELPLDLADPRLVSEIAIFAERSDITEELSRLDSHLVQFREALDADGPVGRTLEFLVQEMAREWNTTGAKASDPEISRLVVEAKAELDRMREQLANIE